MKKYLYLKNKKISVTLKHDAHEITTQIANAICMNILPEYDRVIKSLVKIETIYSENKECDNDHLLALYIPILQDVDIDITESSYITSSIEVMKGLVFNTIESHQEFVDDWFGAYQKVFINKGKINFKVRFIDDMVDDIRLQLNSHVFNKSDILVLDSFLPIVEAYDSELTVELKHMLNKYVNSLRSI